MSPSTPATLCHPCCLPDSAEREKRRTADCQTMLDAGAHFAIDSVAGLPHVLDEINWRLARGEHP